MGAVALPYGSLSVEQMRAVLGAVQVDLTFVDAEGIVRFFSEYRIFSRPQSCLDRHVLDCHSPETRPGIERMLSEFASGWREEAVFLTHQDERPVNVRYEALRDAEGNYLGCLETAFWAPAERTLG